MAGLAEAPYALWHALQLLKKLAGSMGAVLPAGTQLEALPAPFIPALAPLPLPSAPPELFVLVAPPPAARAAVESFKLLDEQAPTRSAAKVAPTPLAIRARDLRSPPIPFAIRELRRPGKFATYMQVDSVRAAFFVSCATNRRMNFGSKNTQYLEPDQ
jgi:hypothetical protein